MKKAYNTYKKSGVNMATVDKLVNYISEISRNTYKTFIYRKKNLFQFLHFLRCLNHERNSCQLKDHTSFCSTNTFLTFSVPHKAKSPSVTMALSS